MELFKLLGTIAIDNTKADEAIDETTKKAKDSEGKQSSAFSKIGSAAVAGAEEIHDKICKLKSNRHRKG